MQLSTDLTVVLTCIVAIAAMPLQLEYDDGTGLPDYLKQATAEVNRQIPKMKQSLNDAAVGDEAAIKRVELAFGPQGVNLIPEIRTNIETIETGTVKVAHLTAKEVDEKYKLGPINGITPYNNRLSTNEPLVTGPVGFGTLFNKNYPKRKNNAAVVLHEATHALFGASDNHYTTGNKDMAPLGVLTEDDEVKKNGGYAAEDPVIGSTSKPITDARLSDNFKELRASATNMHMNADSYALFGAVCNEQMARRRKRALIEDDPVAYVLAKRGSKSCKLPPDYFKNKAAANAAKEKAALPNSPASKTGLDKATAVSTPASKVGLAKAATKNAVGAGSVSQKTVKGAKPAAASKVRAKPFGKATKYTLPKTSKSSLSKGSLKAPNAKVPTTRISKASTRSKLSTSKPPKLSSKATSPKRGVPGVAKKGSGHRVKQTKKSSTRSPTSRGKQTSKQLSNLSRLNASKKKSPKATSSQRTAAAVPLKFVRKKASTPAQKATKAYAAPNKVTKALPTSAVASARAAVPPKKKGGKP